MLIPEFRRSVLGAALLCLTINATLVAHMEGQNDPELLSHAFDEACHEGDWRKAIATGVKLEALYPNDSHWPYNLARVYARSGNVDRALKGLDRAARGGFDLFEKLEQDPDLASVRRHVGFGDVLVRIRHNRDTKNERLARGYEKHPPLVFVPPGHDRERPAPLVIAMHGYGADAKDMAGAWRDVAAARGAILAVPQAVRRVKGAGWSWARVEDAEFLVQRTLDDVVKAHRIDKNRVILSGFSQGGFMSYAMAVRNLSLFSGVIPMGTGYQPAIDAPPNAPSDDAPRFYFMVGAQDRVVRETRKAARDFEAAGYAVGLRVYPGVGHSFPLDPESELRKALAFVMGD